MRGVEEDEGAVEQRGESEKRNRGKEKRESRLCSHSSISFLFVLILTLVQFASKTNNSSSSSDDIQYHVSLAHFPHRQVRTSNGTLLFCSFRFSSLFLFIFSCNVFFPHFFKNIYFVWWPFSFVFFLYLFPF